MHSTPEAAPAHYVSGPLPLSFHELYTPRSKDCLKVLDSREKSFWRTRDRILFTFYEDLNKKCLCVTCHNSEKQETYRTIFLNLEVLYFEIEAKARGDRVPLTKKKDKRFDQTTMTKQVVDYVFTRLNIGQAPLTWPTSSDDSLTQEAEGTQHQERMCTFDKLSSDEWESMEISPPVGLSVEGINHAKLSPTLHAELETQSIPLSANETRAVIGNSPPSESVAPLVQVSGTQTISTDITTTASATRVTAKPGKSSAISSSASVPRIVKKPSGGTTSRKKVVPIG
jgi:hypothetical protein